MHGRMLPRLVVLAALGAMLFGNLGGARLFDRDEALNASCGREMFESGNYVVPTFNGNLRTAKPALVYWLMSASYATFGVTEFAARFFSAVASLGTLVCVYFCGRLLFGERVGLFAPVVLMTGLLFAAVGRACTPDPFLLFSFTLAMTCFVAGVVQKNGRFVLASPDPRDGLPGLVWWTAVSAAMGLAVLAKGPVGVILPTGVIGLYLLWATDARREIDPTANDRPAWQRWLLDTTRLLSPARIWRCGWAMRPLMLFGIAIAIAAPWYLLVSMQTNGEWGSTFFWHDNVRRFTSSLEGHDGPIVYYVPAILIGFFPWSPFLAHAISAAWRTGWVAQAEQEPEADAHRFLICWAGLVVLLFSLAGTKLPNYVLPAYPALALLTARQLERWAASTTWDRGLWLGGLSLAVCGAGLTVAAGVAGHFVLLGHEWLAIVGLPSLVAGVCVFVWSQTGSGERPVRALLAGAVGCVVAIMGVAAPAVSTQQDGVTLGRDARQREPEGGSTAVFAYFAPNLVFYSGGQVTETASPQEAAAHVAGDADALLVIPEDQWDNVRPHLPASATILSRRREFLKDRTLLLVGRPGTLAAGDANAPR